MFRAIYTVNHTFSPFQGEKKDRIEDEIKTHLVRIIRQNCTMCYDLTTAFLRKGSFLCQRNPTHFTYRSTLVNPFPTTNSSELLGIIQSWVSSGPTLVPDGLSVRVNRYCPSYTYREPGGQRMWERSYVWSTDGWTDDSSTQCVHSEGNWAPTMHW